MHEHHEHHHQHDPRSHGGHPHGPEARAAFGGFGGHFGLPGHGPIGSRGRGKGRGPQGRARRGDVRAAIFILLAERPMHGYEIIQELAERTNGIWKVSPGSVYPALQLLEDEGHIIAEQDAGKRRFSLTESGKARAGELAAGKSPWEEVLEGVDPGAIQLRETIEPLIGAVIQIGRVGTPEQQAEATGLLNETRKKLYAILAADA